MAGLNKHFAHETHVTEAAVKAHVTAIFRKLHVKNSIHAAVAIQYGSVALPRTMCASLVSRTIPVAASPPCAWARRPLSGSKELALVEGASFVEVNAPVWKRIHVA